MSYMYIMHSVYSPSSPPISTNSPLLPTSPFLRFTSPLFILWHTVLNQGCLPGHRFGENHWTIVGSPVPRWLKEIMLVFWNLPLIPCSIMRAGLRAPPSSSLTTDGPLWCRLSADSHHWCELMIAAGTPCMLCSWLQLLPLACSSIYTLLWVRRNSQRVEQILRKLGQWPT